jgi:hypothetical protein
MKKIIAISLLTLFLSTQIKAMEGLLFGSIVKEVITDTLILRRTIVGDDWVLVKKNNTLYRRYIPTKGFLFFRVYKGNQNLLQETNKITKWNQNIVVFGSYEKAMQQLAIKDESKTLNPIQIVISDESKSFVPNPNQRIRNPLKRWWRHRIMHTL